LGSLSKPILSEPLILSWQVEIIILTTPQAIPLAPAAISFF